MVVLVAGFLVFRLLDIVKPWPAGRFEDLPGGFGIMADDLMAGLYGRIVMLAAALAHTGVVLMRRIDRAEIIAAGSELLTPHRLDTNSLYLTGRLNALGVVLGGKCVVRRRSARDGRSLQAGARAG